MPRTESGNRRHLALVAAAGSAVLLASGCSYLSGEGGGGGGTDAADVDCAPFEAWSEVEGTVSIYSSIRDEEAERMDRSWADFEACTGIDIQHEGSGEFEAQLPIRLEGGNAPDLALIPQPGLLQRVVDDGYAVPVADGVRANAEEGWGEDWLGYATFDGELYGTPYGANMKSMVWYSPTYFAENGYEVPQSWDEMVELSDTIAESGTKPWCVGFESGDATGWPGTDWIENALLRSAGTDVYNQWVSHEIPFDDPQVAEAFELAGDIVRNPDYVNGTFGEVESIAVTSFQEAGLPLLDGGCAMYLMGSFYSAQFEEGVTVAEDGDVYGFVMPPLEAGAEVPVMGGGEFAVPFADRPEVAAVHEYLSTPEYANSRASQGAWVSANRNMDPTVIEDPASQFAAEVLLSPDTVFHFDGSDAMPSSVGTNVFWNGMVDWVTGTSTEDVLETIESAWP